jgi:electron transfer flavoprotein alpha subunit
MGNDVIVLAEHLNGKLSDITFEMTGKATQLAATSGGQAIAVLLGSGAQSLAQTIGADAVLVVDDPALAEFNPESLQSRVDRLDQRAYSATGDDRQHVDGDGSCSGLIGGYRLAAHRLRERPGNR